MSSSPPSIATLYLAFRQAKTALYFERRGVGLLELAKYEQDLPNNLRALQIKLANHSWFDNIELGETWVVPKRIRDTSEWDDGVVRIGAQLGKSGGRPVDIQLRLSPSPEFAILEVLYLWRFGGQLDGLLSDREVLGYRLDLRHGQIKPNRRWLFQYWPPQYQKFRTAPLNAAKRALENGNEVLVISGDLASFYDTVAPRFMLDEHFIGEILNSAVVGFDVDEYRHATSSLLSAYERFHAEATRKSGTLIDIGVPIGALTSRLVANLALAPLDRLISKKSNVLCYRRYVDDLVIVANGEGRTGDREDILSMFLPLKERLAGTHRLDVESLGRAGSEFQLQMNKVRVHHLAGIAGTDFVDAVKWDFKRTVSERRAFVDSATMLGDGVTHLVRAGEAEGSPLRVLRDADRARLERYALSTSLHSLERVSSLVDQDEARDHVRRNLERVGRVLDGEDNWVDDLGVSLRLLKLAISTGDWQSATELNDRMDRIWGSVGALREAVGKFYYRGREIDSHKPSPWISLRNYLHARRVEAVASSLPIGVGARQIESGLPGGIWNKTSRVGATALRHRAKLLALSDLRSRDREDDSRPSEGPIQVDYEWLQEELAVDESLRNRLVAIKAFVKRCQRLKSDHAWLLSPARLFLCTRPPSYFDIARRWLLTVETDGFTPKVFERLLGIVNAVRGTDYRDPVGTVINQRAISIQAELPSEPSSSRDPRIILGNLVVSDQEWEGAATWVTGSSLGNPVLSVKRLLRVALVLDKAARAASRGSASSVLVLPELSLPRQWFRAVSNHVVRRERRERFGMVVGLEYLHDPQGPYVYNQVFAVMPGPYSSVATWPWTKRLPARGEGINLASLPIPVSYHPVRSPLPRTVVKSPWGSFSVLICSEMIEARRIADLLGHVNVVFCPAWNPDTSSYDHLIQSAGFQLHAVIAIANNGHYSDCRAWAPRSKRWERDLCRLIERDNDDVVHVDIPLTSLEAFHSGSIDAGWRPLPPDWP